MKKIKKFNVEIYFYKNEHKSDDFSDIPELDKYENNAVMDSITASDVKSAKENLLKKYPNAAYIHIHYISDYSY